MKIKTRPHQYAPQQTIVIKEKRGCGGGCLLAVLLVVAFAVATLWMWAKSEQKEFDREIAFDKAQISGGSSGASAAGALGAWQIVRSTDEISDETSYIFALRGLRVTDGNLVEYYPRLIIQAKPKFAPGAANHVEYTARVAVKIEADRFRRDTQEVTLRIDRREPQTGILETSDTRECVFLPSDTLAALDGSNTLVLRFTSTLGNTRTLKFNLTGFTVAALEKELAERMAKDRPANR